MDLKGQITEAMKEAMRAQAKERLGTIRMIQARIKQKEVDERITLNDEQVLSILDKMIRERKEAIKQFEVAKRDDLVQKESAEIEVIQEFLPAQLSNDEINSYIEQAIKETGAASIRDMGKVMAVLKGKCQGRADMAMVGDLIKKRLS